MGTMDDEFLIQFCEAPRAEFATALYEHISQSPRSQLAWITAGKLTFRNVAVAFVIMCLIAACVYAVTEKRWDQIGDVWVKVGRTHKVELVSPDALEMPQMQTECLTVDKAREALGFDFHVPSWAPEGFTLDDRICDVEQLEDFAHLNWESADTSTYILFTSFNLRYFNSFAQEYETLMAETNDPVVPGSYKEVQVNGKPAALIRGDWDLQPFLTEVPPGRKVDADGYVDAKWDKKRALQLYWVDGNILYRLYAPTNVSSADLIKMAESAH